MVFPLPNDIDSTTSSVNGPALDLLNRVPYNPFYDRKSPQLSGDCTHQKVWMPLRFCHHIDAPFLKQAVFQLVNDRGFCLRYNSSRILLNQSTVYHHSQKQRTKIVSKPYFRRTLKYVSFFGSLQCEWAGVMFSLVPSHSPAVIRGSNIVHQSKLATETFPCSHSCMPSYQIRSSQI